MQVSAHLPVHRYIASLLAALIRYPGLPPEFLEVWQHWVVAGALPGADALYIDSDEQQPTALATLAVRPLQIQAWFAQASPQQRVPYVPSRQTCTVLLTFNMKRTFAMHVSCVCQ